jgi:hypothetical protein
VELDMASAIRLAGTPDNERQKIAKEQLLRDTANSMRKGKVKTFLACFTCMERSL